MKNTFILSFFMFLAVFGYSQQITNANFEIIDKKIVVTYDITGAKKDQKFDVKLYYSKNGGNFIPIISNLTGDIGTITATYDGNITNKKITWNALGAYDKINARLQFDIRATVTEPFPAPEMVYVKGGTFSMGSNDGDSDEKPIHSVTVSDFYMSKYEVTNEQFCAFLNDYGSDKVKSRTYSGETMIYEYSNWGCVKSGSKWIPASGKSNHPVVYVTWYGANEYCNWLSQKTGERYSLPTEAEWEYAAGGGVKMNGRSSQRWAGTNSENSLGSYAWYSSNSDSKTHQVGTKSPNELGLYDMSGNVLEWCSDWYGSDYYSKSPSNNPQGPTSGSLRVLRGGSWSDYAYRSRVAYRFNNTPTNCSYGIGFRIIKTP